MTTQLPPRVETFTCDECDEVYEHAIIAARCAQWDIAEND